VSTPTGIFLFDSQSRTQKELIISDGSALRIYCCGPTVYRDAHVGNLRTFLLADLVLRLAKLKGFDSRLIQNITDVGHMGNDFEDDSESEDKVIAQAKQEKLNPFDIARKYEEKFHQDLAHLRFTPTAVYPRASESILLMQNLISELLSKNHAYIGKDKSVYFDSQSFASYGAISGNRLDALKPGHRYDYVDDGKKLFHADWALWKAAGSRTSMIWESPWGEGFPGWHVECSAMALHYLDGHVDLHIGGIDLRFPHHENERAQSNGVTATEAVDVWLHGEHLLFEGRKMSKSAGNVVLLADLIERGFDPLALRLCFMETKYRSQMDLTWKAIEAADATIKRWRNKYQEWRQDVSHVDPEALQSLLRGIISDLSTDLDTPKAIIKLREIERDESISRTTRANLFEIVDQFFGLGITDNRSIRVLGAEEEKLLNEREIARAQRDFAKSDELREALLARKIKVIDTPTSQTWEVI